MTVIEQYTAWLKEKGKSQGTITVYTNAVNKLVEWYESSKGQVFEPSNITSQHLIEYYQELDAGGRLTLATVNKNKTGLKSFFNFTYNKNITAENPSGLLKLKRTKTQGTPRYLSKLEQIRYFEIIHSRPKDWVRARDLAMCKIMLGAGLLVQEVAYLCQNDICLEQGREMVNIQSGKVRQVPLPSDVLEAVKDWLGYRKKMVETDHDILFISNQGSALNVRSIYKIVTKYAILAGLEDVSPLTLRHTFCRNLIAQGVPIEQAALLAGHSDKDSTRRYIDHGDYENR